MDKKRNKFKREEDFLVYQSNERERNRVARKVEWDVFTSEGRCGKCGNECEINPKSGKKYKYCEKHRLEINKRSARYWKTKKAGMAKLANASDLKSDGSNTLMGSIPSTRTI